MERTLKLSLIHRARNLTAFLRWTRLKAAIGLLSGDDRHRWIRTIGTKRLKENPLNETYPWFAFSSIAYLAALIRPDMKVVEYGSGYSTIWWASRVGEVTSVERSREWLAEVDAALSKHALKNAHLIPFNKFSPGTEEEIRARCNWDMLSPAVSDYVLSAGVLPKSCDVVVIDDIFRNEVALAAIEIVKPGGLLILDDSERERYLPTIKLLGSLGWSFASFYGSPPYHFHEKQTTIWFKPSEK
jgi:hypothetical protein